MTRISCYDDAFFMGCPLQNGVIRHSGILIRNRTNIVAH